MFTIQMDGDNAEIWVTGTCYRIHTGTAEIEEVMNITALEGEWAKVESNPFNIMIQDIELLPLARNSQHFLSDNNAMPNNYEFPHHHRAPAMLSGTVTLLDSQYYIWGLVTKGDYVFFSYSGLSGNKLVRESVLTGAKTEIDIDGEAFSVLDQDKVVYTVADSDGFLIEWRMHDFSTGADTWICTTPDRWQYLWHWGITKDILCIMGWYETFNWDAPVIISRHFGTYMYNIYSKNLLWYYKMPTQLADAFAQYAACADMVIKRKYFCEFHSDQSQGDYPGASPETAMLFVFNTDPSAGGSSGGIGVGTYNMSLIRPLYNKGIGGNMHMFQLTYNPFNGMIYYIAKHGWSLTDVWQAVFIMSPDNYSYAAVFEAQRDPDPVHYYDPMPMMLIPSTKELYCVLGNGTVYNVRDFANPLPYTFPIAAVDPTREYDSAQYDNGSSVVDEYGRFWYLDGSMLYAMNIETGVIETQIDTGIPTPSWTYPYPNPFRQIYLAGDRVLILYHPTYPSAISSIYRID